MSIVTVSSNSKSILGKLGRSRRIKRKLGAQMLPRVQKAQEEMQEEFDRHLITEEIELGPYAANISGTLTGSDGGNLFGFIGFDQNEDPLEPIRRELSRPITIRSIKHLSGNRWNVAFQNITTKEEIFSQTPFPWLSGNGRSWVHGIEHGIAGFGQYVVLSARKRPGRNSRSGVAYQAKDGSIRRGVFKRTSYISQILNNFKQNLRNLNAFSV